jgi:hypothetical protein
VLDVLARYQLSLRRHALVAQEGDKLSGRLPVGGPGLFGLAAGFERAVPFVDQGRQIIDADRLVPGLLRPRRYTGDDIRGMLVIR